MAVKMERLDDRKGIWAMENLLPAVPNGSAQARVMCGKSAD